ncbi:hypothetical protein CRD19_06615, partial [Corynebacterium sp. LK32]|nr:hypothetical protein [Corynebacterium sp. LK32]
QFHRVLPLPRVKQEKYCPAGVSAGRFSNSASFAEQLARLNAMDGQPMTAPRISVWLDAKPIN